MSENFHEQYQQADVPMPPARSTGVVFTIVALIVAAVFRHNPAVAGIACVTAVALGGLSWRAPHLLEPLNKVWFRIGLLLHKIVNPVVMFAMFCVAIVPMGLIMQLVRDPLRKQPAPDGASYWIEVEPDASPGNSMMNQF